MWVTGIILVVITCWVTEQTQAQYQYPQYCAPLNTTKVDPANPGLQMPPIPYIPDTFQVRVEGNIIDKQYTMIAEEYYDNLNNRAALLTITNNTQDYMIFDYNTNQLIYDVNIAGKCKNQANTQFRRKRFMYTSNCRRLTHGIHLIGLNDNNCSVADLQFDDNQLLFGMKQGTGAGGIPHIYGTNQALHFAKENGLLYKGTKVVRGILCDWWQSCMYWPLLISNFTLDYYFSAYNWTEPDLSNQIPVRAEVTGLQLGSVQFHHIYEYFDYRNRIWADDSIFDTPQGKVCPGRKQTRKVPVLSGQYSYREEIVDTLDQAVSQADVYYDYNYNLVRFDYKPTFSGYPYWTTNPVTEIHDYSTGIAYAIDNTLGNCSMIPIQNTTFDASVQISVNANQSSQFYVRMKSPSQLFYLDNTTYTYEGTRTVRGILCDVFISNRTDFHLPNYGNFSSIFEFYFMNQQWSSSNNIGPNQQQNTDIPVQLRITTPDNIGYAATYNIYNFDSEDPSYNRFSIAGCYDDFSQKNFIIEFPGSWDNSLLQYKNQFVSAITDRISQVGHVSHIRVQNGQFRVEADTLYFVGTLLEVPPPLAFFQLVPSKFRQFTNDQTLTVSGPDDCASACNNPGKLGQCNSFDYCAFQNLCGLSKSHTEDGTAVVNSNGQCDHYVRTAQSQNFDLKLVDAWKNLKNDVIIGNFQVKVTINGQPQTFKAATIDDNVLINAQRTSASQTLLDNFNMQINKDIPGYDDAILTGIAIDDCASACLNQQSWVCNSFTYSFDTGYCTLSKLHPDERPGIVVNHQLVDLYSKKYTVNYQLFQGLTVLSSSDTIYQNIYSADECGKLCTNYNGFNCKSFDYCDDISTCYLGRAHYYDIPQTDKVDSPMCNHYSRKYLYDFKITTRQHLINANDQIISKVSVDQCAKLCVEQEAASCASFGYCGNTTECRLSTASMRNVGQVSSEANLWCDVYNRQSFPDGTPYINNPQKYYSIPNNSGKYTGGAMAGVAFGMIIVGILLAAGVLFALGKCKRQPADGMTVSFVKQEGD